MLKDVFQYYADNFDKLTTIWLISITLTLTTMSAF